MVHSVHCQKKQLFFHRSIFFIKIIVFFSILKNNVLIFIHRGSVTGEEVLTFNSFVKMGAGRRWGERV